MNNLTENNFQNFSETNQKIIKLENVANRKKLQQKAQKNETPNSDNLEIKKWHKKELQA